MEKLSLTSHLRNGLLLCYFGATCPSPHAMLGVNFVFTVRKEGFNSKVLEITKSNGTTDD